MASATSTAPRLPFRLVLWLFALLTVFPFALLVLTSIKSKPDLLQGAFALPAYPHFENYLTAWTDGHFGTYFLNSIIIVIPGGRGQHPARGSSPASVLPS